MSHYFESGFTVRQPAWHKLGTVLADHPESWDDARRAAGLMWEPTYRDLYVPHVIPMTAAEYDGNGETVAARYVDWMLADREARDDSKMIGWNEDRGGIVVHVPVDGHRAIVRDDTGAVLATPSDSFELIYHSQMGELLDAFTESWRKAGAKVKFETAGSLKGGRLVYALVYLDEPYTIAGDDSPTFPYAALLNAHDGSAACKLLPTQVRVVCWNTWNAASIAGDLTGHQVILRHAGNVAERIEAAKESLAAVRDEAAAWRMTAEDLASINVSDAVLQMFIDDFIPVPEGASERTRTARLDRQAIFRELYEGSPTMDGSRVRGTAYGLVQAAGEYLDHLRPYRTPDTYLTRTMLRPESIKTGVVARVRELVASAN